MRIRKLIVGAVLASAAVVVLPHAAFADPGKLQGKELVDCVETALAANKADIAKKSYTGFKSALQDCNKAPSLITPATSEILWGGLAFLIVVVVLIKFAFPPLRSAVKAREEKIRSDLEGAEQARQDAEAERLRYQAQLGDARGEANGIVEEARVAAESVRADLIAKAETDAAEVRARANEDIRLARERAMSDLQRQVADISIGLAEKIVERNLDPDTQAALVESYITSVGK